MSKWGFVSANTAKQKFDSSKDEAALMVEEMSHLLVQQEKEIDSQYGSPAFLTTACVEKANDNRG